MLLEQRGTVAWDARVRRGPERVRHVTGEHAYLLASVWGRATQRQDCRWKCDVERFEGLSMACLRCSMRLSTEERGGRTQRTAQINHGPLGRGQETGQLREGASASATKAPLFTEQSVMARG